MYKTIRHGENSLQYTILPQNDDFRIEGKLTSAESSCSSSGRKSKTKRPKRRSFFAYLGLIFVCTVIVGAVLIPFLVSAECLPNPTQWFMGKQIEKHEKTASPLRGRGNLGFGSAHGSFVGNGINVGKTVKIINQSGVEKIILRVNKTSNATENDKSLTSANSNLAITTSASKGSQNNENINQTNNLYVQAQENVAAGNAVTTINSEQIARHENETEMIAQNSQNLRQLKTEAQKSFKSQNNDQTIEKYVDNNSNPPTEHFVTEVRFEPAESVSSMPPGIVPTIVVTTLRNQLTNNDMVDQKQQQQRPQLQAQTAPNMRPTTAFSTSIQSQSNNANLVAQNSTLMTRIIQVPLLKSAAKKPIMPPVLIKTNSEAAYGADASRNVINPAMITSTATSQLPGVPSVINDMDAEAGPKVVPAKATDWIHGHWPFIDPSTYFQWTGYKAEDSVLLPALLGFALIGIVLIVTVCLVARNKHTIVSSVRRRNRNVSDIEENGAEDNTTLLTTSNLSDED